MQSRQQSFQVDSSLQDAVKDMRVEVKPIPKSCFPQEHVRLGGSVLVSGQELFTETAGDCCKECQDHALCNVWVWCGDPSGTCWSPDNHRHLAGECWLKLQDADDTLDPFATHTVVRGQGLQGSSQRLFDHLTKHWYSGVVPPSMRTAASSPSPRSDEVQLQQLLQREQEQGVQQRQGRPGRQGGGEEEQEQGVQQDGGQLQQEQQPPQQQDEQRQQQQEQEQEQGGGQEQQGGGQEQQGGGQEQQGGGQEQQGGGQEQQGGGQEQQGGGQEQQGGGQEQQGDGQEQQGGQQEEQQQEEQQQAEPQAGEAQTGEEQDPQQEQQQQDSGGAQTLPGRGAEEQQQQQQRQDGGGAQTLSGRDAATAARGPVSTLSVARSPGEVQGVLGDPGDAMEGADGEEQDVQPQPQQQGGGTAEMLPGGVIDALSRLSGARGAGEVQGVLGDPGDAMEGADGEEQPQQQQQGGGTAETLPGPGGVTDALSRLSGARGTGEVKGVLGYPGNAMEGADGEEEAAAGGGHGLGAGGAHGGAGGAAELGAHWDPDDPFDNSARAMPGAEGDEQELHTEDIEDPFDNSVQALPGALGEEVGA